MRREDYFLPILKNSRKILLSDQIISQFLYLQCVKYFQQPKKIINDSLMPMFWILLEAFGIKFIIQFCKLNFGYTEVIELKKKILSQMLWSIELWTFKIPEEMDSIIISHIFLLFFKEINHFWPTGEKCLGLLITCFLIQFQIKTRQNASCIFSRFVFQCSWFYLSGWFLKQ